MSAAEKQVAQAFVELRAEDAEAESALVVARVRLAAGAGLVGLRRLRLFELSGALPGRDELERQLHASIQFYNPAKERCTLRTDAAQPAPVAPEAALVLVLERGGERRAGAERWWRHESGQKIEVREGVVWELRFAPGIDALACAEALAVTTSRAQGLLTNPHVQDARVHGGAQPPLPWLAAKGRRRERGTDEA